MKVWVLVGVYSGCIGDVKLYTEQQQAERAKGRLREEYGIIEEGDAESEHAVDLFEFDV